MQKVNVYNIKGEIVKEVKLNPSVFNVKINEGVVQQTVEAQLANARQVLAHTKDRGEVRGGGKKPWKQKGTGRARHGSSRSPLWIGGGITFGPRKNRNFNKKINKKTKQQALLMCLSDKVKSNLLILLDELNFDKPKTKDILNVLKKLPTLEDKIKKIKTKNKDKNKDTKIEEKKVKELAKTLIIVPGKVEYIYLSVRNLSVVEVIRADSLNVVDLLKYKYLVMPLTGLEVVESFFEKQKVKK